MRRSCVPGWVSRRWAYSCDRSENAPLATELPEKTNSVLWTRRGKDALALGNVTGAMVFQSMVPVAVGLAFTPWAFTAPSTLAVACALAGGAPTLTALGPLAHLPSLDSIRHRLQ